MLSKKEIESNFFAFSDFYHDCLEELGSDNGSKSLIGTAQVKYCTNNSYANFDKRIEVFFGFNDPQEYQFINLEDTDSSKYYITFSTKWQHFKYDKNNRVMEITGADSQNKGIGDYTITISNVNKNI